MAQRNYQPRHRSSPGRTFNSGRDKRALYDRYWIAYSREFLSVNKRCYSCGEPSSVVDHIESHQGSVRLFWQVNNYLPLCKTCHDTVTARFDRRRREGESINPKLAWIARNRSMKDITFKVKVVPFSTDLLLQIENLKLKKGAVICP